MKTALIVLAVIVALIVFLLLVRVGMILQGDLKGINITLRLGLLHIPFRKRNTQKKKKAIKKVLKTANEKVVVAHKKSNEPDDTKPDTEEKETSLTLELIRQYSALAKTALRQVKKSIRIDKLILKAKNRRKRRRRRCA